MRLSLIGPGKIELHFQKFLNIPKENLEKEIKNIAKVLADSQVEIELLPDKGISLEIAKQYKKEKGKKIIAVLPKSDKLFGIRHLQPYLNEKIDHELIFDTIIDSDSWFKHDITKALFGNAVLFLGKSPGTEIERNGAEYLLHIMKGLKENINVSLKKIHPELKANEKYTFFVYSPFILGGKLSREDELYLNEYKIKLVYINNPDELKRELIKFNKISKSRVYK
jgi:hypothetical protein